MMRDESRHLKERLKNLSPEQIKKLMSGRKGSTVKTFTRMPRNSKQVYPLSRAQERIWFLAKLYPDTSLYNIPIAINVKSGQIDPRRLREAINLIVEKHEIFRTTFHENAGQVYQEIHPNLNVEVEYEDISQLESAVERERLIEKIGVKHGNTLFDLAKLPLLTVKLVKKGESDYTLFFNLHHLISDGWTNSLLARDSSLFYDKPGDSLQKKEIVQYVDYVKWEQAWLKSDRHEKQLKFWKKELADFPEPLFFPRDYQREEHSFEGRTVQRDIPQSVYEAVSNYCQKNGLTQYQFYISCYALLLSRYTGELDLVVGTPVANRSQKFFLETYGVFINSLPLRFKIDPELSVGELMKGFRESILESMDNQEIPFSEIINAINPQRKLYGNPLYNVHFAFQHFPQKDKSNEYSLLPIDYRVAKFDLNFWIKIAGDEQSVSVSYQHNLITPEKICRFIDHFLLLAEAVSVQPETSFKELDFIPKKHFSRLAGEVVAYSETPWISLFEKSAQACPAAVALIDGMGEMLYEDLNQQAAIMAYHLSCRGVVKDDIVIVKTGRNRKFIISILACMKCGATYLPVDNRIPPARFTLILTDSKAKIVLTEMNIDRAECLSFEDVQGVECEAAAEKITEVAVQSDDIAYIVYTSGSTGQPKGVCVPHRALINYTHSVKKIIDNVENITTFAHVSALDADLGNTSIFTTLGFAGTLLLPSEEALVDPVLLSAFFSRYPVDAIKIVPAHLNALQASLETVLPRKLLILAGEKLSGELLEKVRQAAPGLRIMNHYGPAEATVSCLTFAVPVKFGRGDVPIGVPITNTQVFILDSERKLVPKGGRGEIYLSGVNIAQGYLRQPDVTAERFFKDLSLSPDLIYKTGDVGCINEDNQVVFLERCDRQIKINGFRIEPGEIEAVLTRHPAVLGCAVFIVGGDDENGLKKIFAAVELGSSIEIRQISNYLAHHFSRAVLPGIIVVDKIPVSRNGKVDVVRLMQLQLPPADVKSNNLPADLVELQLLAIFKSVLRVEALGLSDQFFDLGGHSLLAISLITQVNKTFNTRFPVAVLFESGSVCELAELVRHDGRGDLRSDSPYVKLIDRAPVEDTRDLSRVVWTHPAGGNVMSYYAIAESLSSVYTSKAFMAIDHHSKSYLSIKGIAAEYVDILKRQREVDASILAGWSMGALISHEMAVLLAAEGEKMPLVLVDQPVPNHQPGEEGSYEDKVTSYVERIEVFAGEKIALSTVGAGGLDYGVLRSEFIRLGLMPSEVAEREFLVFLDVLVQHNDIIKDFYPSVYQGPVLLLKAAEKIMLKTSRPQPEYLLEDLGWGEFCPDLTVVEAPGNHITMMAGRHSSKTADLICSWISNCKS